MIVIIDVLSLQIGYPKCRKPCWFCGTSLFLKKNVDDAICLKNAPFQHFLWTWVHSQSCGEQPLGPKPKSLLLEILAPEQMLDYQHRFSPLYFGVT